MFFNSVEEVLADIRSGKPVVLVDDETRENEGDLVVAAELITAEHLSFMFNEARGLVCLSITEETRERLGLSMQVTENGSSFGTNFTVSFNHRSVAGGSAANGAGASARAFSIREAVKPTALASDFQPGGMVFTVCAVPGGVLRRRGQTEGSVDLARLAGLAPAGVICELMDADGLMLRGDSLFEFCRKHDLKITSVDALCKYRLENEVFLRRVGAYPFGTNDGLARQAEILNALKNRSDLLESKLLVYADDAEEQEHFALIFGKPEDNCLVRIHSECLTGDIFSSLRCDCGPQLDLALQKIIQEGKGVLVYLHQEGRGIGLGNKLRAYHLQDSGLDTVDANLELGFAPDLRNYRVGAQILQDLGLSQIRLMTNNPQKTQALSNFGIQISERVPLSIPLDEHNKLYLLSKKTRLGHWL